MADNTKEQFLDVITSLFDSLGSINDPFFVGRLKQEIKELIDGYIRYSASGSADYLKSYIKSLRDLEKRLEEIDYVKKGEAVTLAMSREIVSRHILDLVRLKSKPQIVLPKETPLPQSVSKVSMSATNKAPSNGASNKLLTGTQEKILEFIRREPDCRAKDIVGQFSSFSERTVKRNLKELSDEGLLVKRVESGGAVFYSTV